MSLNPCFKCSWIFHVRVSKVSVHSATEHYNRLQTMWSSTENWWMSGHWPFLMFSGPRGILVLFFFIDLFFSLPWSLSRWMLWLLVFVVTQRQCLFSLGKVGNPSLSVNNTLLVVIYLGLVRELFFSIPKPFRNVQWVMTCSQACVFYRSVHTGVLINKLTGPIYMPKF